MGWQRLLVVLLTLWHIASSTPTQLDDFDKDLLLNDLNENEQRDGLEEMEEDVRLEKLSNILSKLLVMPWPQGVSPLLYVENNENHEELEGEGSDDGQIAQTFPEFSGQALKRSRYYRKYPWKRQNSRCPCTKPLAKNVVNVRRENPIPKYDAENRYLCQPSKDDVFRLLVALHEARQGNRGHMVNFCNRKRPATAVFTNIRFLGKRK